MLILLHKMKYLIILCILVEYLIEEINTDDQRDWSVGQGENECEGIGSTGNQTCNNDSHDHNDYSCKFTHSKCHWSDDTAATFNWTRHQGRSAEQADTGPSGDHTMGASGWYIYIESSKPRKPSDAARLISPMIPSTSKMCFQFWYYMYGANVGKLTVYSKAKLQSRQKEALWIKAGTFGQRWRHGIIDISSDSTFQLILEGTVGNGESGDIALDDLSINNGNCPPSSECTFEDPNLGGWTIRGGNNVEWKRANYHLTRNKGPKTDHTYGTANGYYLYGREAWYNGFAARFESGEYPPTIGRCCSFWYVNGDSGRFTILISQNENNKYIWQETGTPSNSEWIASRFTIKSSVKYKIIFEITYIHAGAAIDDIVFTDVPCEEGTCNFERGKCLYTNSKTANFDWLIGSGHTSRDEGPLIDHSSGTNLGQYMFMLPSSQQIHETAVLQSEEIHVDVGVGKCLSFWYYMQGDHVGSLHIQMEVKWKTLTTVWQLSGDQSNKWIYGKVPLISQGESLIIHFVAVRGLDDKGKLAIDDISLITVSTSCLISPVKAVSWGCNFETGLCKWQKKKIDKFGWDLKNGSRSAGNRPRIDHTTSTKEGKYMFFSATWKGRSGTGDLVSSPISTNGVRSPFCLAFAHFVSGHFSSPVLQIYTKNERERKPVIWRSGVSPTSSWENVNVQMNVMDQTKVVFEGVVGNYSVAGGISIDDIEISYGDCPNSGMCSFEGHNICDWKIGTSKVKWERKSASTLEADGGPVADHTYNTKYGHFMYLNATESSVKSSMSSDKYSVPGRACIQFFYYIDLIESPKNDTFIKLDVFIVNQSRQPGFHTSGTHKDWNMGQVTVINRNPISVEVLATKQGSKHVIFAFDDFRIRNGICPPIGNCDFEHGDLCSWRQDMSDDFDWLVGSGHTPGFNTGPSVDHTTNNTGGFYAFIDSSMHRVNAENATIKSVLFDPTTGRCLSFWYNMNGASVATLSVLIKYPSSIEMNWQLDGNQGKEWKSGRLCIISRLEYQILFQAVRRTGNSGNIAIDDIEFTVGKCSLLPPNATPRGKSTVVPTETLATTFGPTTGNNNVDCNFDENACPNWQLSATRKEFNWVRHNGETDTRDTGPHHDHTTRTDKGYYIYIDASPPADLNDTAWLSNNNVENKFGGCFEFWYHMYGEHVGMLSLYSTVKGTRTWQWSRMGTQGDQWKHGQIYINKEDGKMLYIAFVGIRRDGYAGDIALDDISFAKGKTCKYRECTFEEPVIKNQELRCGWTNVKSKDDFDWVISSGYYNMITGPSSDHTLGTDKGHYVSMRTGRLRSQGLKALIISQVYTATPEQCFTFWYFMHGRTMGNLTLLQRVHRTDTILWIQRRAEGQHWRKALVTVKSRSVNFQLVFKGTVGGRYGDIALDDMLKVDGACPLPGDCNFEDFILCEYIQDQFDDFDWIRGHGSTRTNRTGPESDHTIGDMSGHYYYIHSASEKPGGKARLTSQLFSATNPSHGRCLQFYRQMYGTGIGELKVYIQKDYILRNDKEILIWSDSGNHGNNWIMSQAPIFSEVPYRLIFEAVEGSPHGGVIAIDDINFSNYFSPCTYIPSYAAPTSPPPTTITPADSNCTFDHRNFCRWSNLKLNEFDWYLAQSCSYHETGPRCDHTTGNPKKGYFAVLHIRYASPNDTAVLRSPYIQSSLGTICFKFAYFIYGRDVDVLNIYNVAGNNRERIWTRAHDLGNFWRDGQVEIKGIKSIFHIEVEGIRGNGKYGDIAVDDFVVSDGACPSDGFCDFEDSMCGYTYNSFAKFHWIRGNDGKPALGDGPEVDHTTGTKLGNYLYVKTSDAKKENSTAIIESRAYPANHYGGVCFNFWYHLMGKDIGAINIYIKRSRTARKQKLWTKSGDHGDMWRHGRVTIVTNYLLIDTYKVIIEGIVGKNYKGDIAIDDVWIDDHPCPTKGACDFESHSFCSWKQVSNKLKNKVEDNIQGWRLSIGKTMYGPFFDHTRGNLLGTYVSFQQQTKVRKRSKGELISETFSATNGQCLSFWYALGGNSSDFGGLNVYIKGKRAVILYSGTFATRHLWYLTEVGLYSKSEFRVIIEAYVNANKLGSVAIDDINIVDGICVRSCSSIPSTARVPCGPSIVSATICVNTYGCCFSNSTCFYHTSSCQSIAVPDRVQCGSANIRSYTCERIGCCYDSGTNGLLFRCHNSPVTPTALTSTFAPTTTHAPLQYDCTFEHGWCNFINLRNDQLNWMIQVSGSSIIKNDHTLKNNRGHYVSFFSRWGRHFGQIANLQTPTISFTRGGDNVCVRFWYRMHGTNGFKVYNTTGNGNLSSPLWFRSGDVPRGWNYAQSSVPRMPPFKITFQGIQGHGYENYIILDDVSFINGPCPANLFCDFENGDLCGWSQDASDDFNWSRGSGNSTAKDAGPDNDHTYQTPYGTYLYIEGNGHKLGDKARLESFPSNPTDGSCVEFYYYMKGVGIGTLNVWIRGGDYVDKTSPAWTLSGDQGGEWTRAFVTVMQYTQKWKVIFEGVHGANEYSDIAIDDIRILPGACIPRGDCDFEDSLCGYENARNNTIDWVTNSGNSLQALKTAPRVDHTTGFPIGHFISMVGGTDTVKTGHIISDKFLINGNYKWCIEFWYFMFGDGEQSLSVHTRYLDRNHKIVDVQIFGQTGNYDDRWMMGKANVTSGYNFQIVFEGSPSHVKGIESVVAIDDIKVTKGLCSGVPVPTPAPCAVHCKDRTCISGDKVCDFFPDCAQGRDKTDMSDEVDCDQCDFEKGLCRWKDVSKGKFSWNRRNGKMTSKGNTGRSKDHTTGTAFGHYVYTDPSQGLRNDMAVFDSPIIRQTHSTCRMEFWYSVYGNSKGTLSVYILYGDRLTLLWTTNRNKGDKWYLGVAYINRRVNPFKIKIKAERRSITLDDIKFLNCSLPKPSTICLPDHFLCRQTQACIPTDRVCDYTDDCGDGSDEIQCVSERYPYRCNFEDGFCSWGIVNEREKFPFYRRTKQPNYRRYGPYYDHTTLTLSGHYIAGVVNKLDDMHRVYHTRIGSAVLQVTSKGFPCQIRFYYYYVGMNPSKFNVKIRQCTGEGCKESTAWSTQKDVWYNWVRKNVTLKSSKPFQVVLELEAIRFAALLIDDVSFDGCSVYKRTLPSTIGPTKKRCAVDQYYCKKDDNCISSKYRCDYRPDCSDGQDELKCGSCDFSSDWCGYSVQQSGNITFNRSLPGGANPPYDHTHHSTTGYFAISVSHITKLNGVARLGVASLQMVLSKTSPMCLLEFYYYYNSSGVSILWVEYSNLHVGISSILLQPLQSLKEWRRIVVAVGQRPDSWSLSIKTNHTHVAVDDINFLNCSFPRPNGSCNANQFKCKDGSCIGLDQVCDFVTDCGDGSDENEDTCKHYKERCNFEKGICNWHQESSDDFDWSRGNAKTASDVYAPAVDHSTGTSAGFFLFIKGNALGITRLKSVVFKASHMRCRMRFFYHMFGKHVSNLFVEKRTYSNPTITMDIMWEITGDKGNYWHQATIDFNAHRDFQVVILAEVTYGFQGDIAIDDISFTIGCHPDLNATLISEPPACDPDTEFSCGDGQCVPLWKKCNFVIDCDQKTDEVECPSSCDLEGEDHTCGWYNEPKNDMHWSVCQGLTPSNGTGPRFDHTKGTKEGHFLYIEADQKTEVNFPTGYFLSPLYNHGSYDCKFSFWYHMYHAKVQDNNDAMLNVLYRRNGVDTKLFQTSITSGPKWKQANVQLPRCPDNFMVVFEGRHYFNTKTDISIDDWKFDCSVKTPPKCNATTHFQCNITKQCVLLDSLCDMDRNCCDGTDESEKLCKAYTRYNFESGITGWTQLKDDDIDFTLSSGEASSASSLQTGPSTDHTFQESNGKYIYIDASQAKVDATAVIVSDTIHPILDTCVIRFWYHMYGKSMGNLTVSIAYQYGVSARILWSLAGNQKNEWKKATITLPSVQDCQVMFAATVGSDHRSDMALDDITLSPGCRLSNKTLPGGPTPAPVNPCKPLFQCTSSKKCIPRNQVCDFQNDCPDGEDEGNVTCGYPQGFEMGFGGWKNSAEYDFEFIIYHKQKESKQTAPKTDARGDKDGSFAYLDVTNKIENGKAVLSSPVFQNAYSNCVLNFSYYMHGEDVGQIKVRLRTDYTNPTTLFDVKGNLGNNWTHSQIAVGRRRQPFILDIIAYAGGGDGGIGIDEINFVNCFLPHTCDGHTDGKFKCKNNLCIDKTKVCDFVDDCGDLSDEDPNAVCSNYIGCNFDDFAACNFMLDLKSNFQWTLLYGETPSVNTGPTHDHTYQTFDGLYMYIEASGQVIGDRARIFTFPMISRQHVACNMLFYYYMRGSGEGQLNVYTMKTSTNISKLEWKLRGDQELGWQQAKVEFSSLSASGDEFVVIIEGVIGNSFEGDTAVDDVRFSPGCFSNVPRVFPTIKPCRSNEFPCKHNGNCRSKRSKCNGKRDCKDGSDESGCPGKKGKQKGSHKVAIAIWIVVPLIALIIVVLTTYFVVKRRSTRNSSLNIAEHMEVQPNSEHEDAEKAAVATSMARAANTEFINPAITGFSDTYANTFGSISRKDKDGTTSAVNPLYQDPFLEGVSPDEAIW